MIFPHPQPEQESHLTIRLFLCSLWVLEGCSTILGSRSRDILLSQDISTGWADRSNRRYFFFDVGLAAGLAFAADLD